AADRREGLARLTGQVNALKSRAAAADDEIGRLTLAQEDAVARADRAQRDFTSLETQVAGLDAGEEGLDAEHEKASDALSEVEERLAAVRDQAAQADRSRSTLAARKDALEMGLNRKDGAGALLADSDAVPGLLGSVAALITVTAGYEAAVAGALGAAADAVAVADADAAVAAISHLRAGDLGRAGLVLAGGAEPARDWPALPDHATYAADAVECPDTLRAAITRILARIAVVDDLDAAQALVADLPDVVAVTRDGDLLGAHVAGGGSTAQQSLIEIQSAVDDAAAQLAEATATGERLGFEQSTLETTRLDAQKRVDVALARLHESDATLAAVAEELGQYGSQARAAKGEAERLAQAIEKATSAREADLAGLAELEERLATAQDAPDEEPDTTERTRLVDAAKVARQGEMDARLALRTAEERARALHGRVDNLLRQAKAERDTRARAAERRERMLREGRAAEAVSVAAGYVLSRLEISIYEATQARMRVEQARGGRERELIEVRAVLRELGKEHDELVNSVHRDEMARTQQRMRIEQLEERAIDELGLDVEALVAEFGPDQLVPPSLAVPDEGDAASAGSGGGDDSNYEDVRYEGYGPGGVALIVDTLTDNRNRTASEVRSAFSKYGGNLGETNSVSFMFNRVGQIIYPAEAGTPDAILEAAIEAGAENAESSETEHEITCAVEDFIAVRDALEESLGSAQSAQFTWKPLNAIAVDEDQAGTLLKLFNTLEDNDDVQQVSANFEIADDIMAKLTA
uniref:YebC/PmpR family DNA-binding transcriptional regulator n=1 Tax=Nocardioides sp. TaxID=35761 RepID=UPI002B277353